MRGFFQATKAIYGPSLNDPTQLRTHNGTTLLKDDAAIKQRWKEYFEALLNRESVLSHATVESIPQHPVQVSLADLPTFEEVSHAINQTKNNMAPGPDGILLRS